MKLYLCIYILFYIRVFFLHYPRIVAHVDKILIEISSFFWRKYSHLMQTNHQSCIIITINLYNRVNLILGGIPLTQTSLECLIDVVVVIFMKYLS